jgi:hypothetical protein
MATYAHNLFHRKCFAVSRCEVIFFPFLPSPASETVDITPTPPNFNPPSGDSATAYGGDNNNQNQGGGVGYGANG